MFHVENQIIYLRLDSQSSNYLLIFGNFNFLKDYFMVMSKGLITVQGVLIAHNALKDMVIDAFTLFWIEVLQT